MPRDPIEHYKDYLLAAANTLHLITESMDNTSTRSLSPRQVGDWSDRLRDVHQSMLNVLKSRQGMFLEMKKLKMVGNDLPQMQDGELRWKYVKQ
jgi:hypothetical protein